MAIPERLPGLVERSSAIRSSPAAASLTRVLDAARRRAGASRRPFPARAPRRPRTGSRSSRRSRRGGPRRGRSSELALDDTIRSPRSGLRPFAPRNNSPRMDDAEADRVLDRDDQKVVEAAAVTEPVFGLGDQVDVAVDRLSARRAGPARSLADVEIALGEERAVAADARGALDDPRQCRRRGR